VTVTRSTAIAGFVAGENHASFTLGFGAAGVGRGSGRGEVTVKSQTTAPRAVTAVRLVPRGASRSRPFASAVVATRTWHVRRASLRLWAHGLWHLR
jgi:hypothetical protein